MSMSSILNGRCAFKRARSREQSRCARAASAPRCARAGWAPQSQIKFKRTALICPLWCDRKAGNAACSVGCSEGKRPLRKKARTSGRLLVVARDDSDCMLSRVARIGRSLVARAKKRRRWLSHAQWTAGLASIAKPPLQGAPPLALLLKLGGGVLELCARLVQRDAQHVARRRAEAIGARGSAARVLRSMPRGEPRRRSR